MSTRKNIEAQRKKQRQNKLRTQLIWGGIALAAVIIVGLIGWRSVRPSSGEQIPIMANSEDHVSPGNDPGPFNSNPPTSGRHYGQSFEAGFYDETSPQAQTDFPEGYLGHNLEHGYVIFWYNCALLDDTACETLKLQIKGVMDEFKGVKLIAFPSDSVDVPLAMVSWGRLLTFENFDEKLARDFVSTNRNRSPEPDAD
jgi:hypothetical protein